MTAFDVDGWRPAHPAAAADRGFSARLAEQPDPRIGDELIEIRHDDGRAEELRLHDYERLYALPGVYEEIVHDRLGCTSPAQIAAALADELRALGRDPAATRVLDVAAGNGISGEALAAAGVGGAGRYGTDIVDEARLAALRDRPGVYDDYLTLDLLSLSAARAGELRALRCDALACVAPVGEWRAGQVPVAAFAAAVALLADDALVAYMHQPGHGGPDPVTSGGLDAGAEVQERRRRRYVHRRTVNGAPFEMEAVVLRVRRRGRPSVD